MHTKKAILSKLLFNIRRGEEHYKCYKKNSIYNYALSLHRINSLIIELIEEHIEKFDITDHQTFIEWIIHLDTWRNQFEYLRDRSKPDLRDSFIFERIEGSYPYPIDLRVKIENLLEGEE